MTALELPRRPPRRRVLARSSRLAIWAFAFALLVKAAVPLLASASASLQGLAIADVCDVYGVRTIALDADGQPKAALPVTMPSMTMEGAALASGHAHQAAHDGRSAEAAPGIDDGDAAHSDHARHHGDHAPEHGAHSGDHCALTAMVALAATAAPTTAVPLPTAHIAGTRTRPLASAPIDASARWAARIEHGPPAAA